MAWAVSGDARLYILDAIGPFFRGYERPHINWSKIPFDHLEDGQGGLDAARFAGIREDFDLLCRRASETGFNALSIDDVAHLIDAPFYPAPLREKIRAYRREYARLFELAAQRELAVYVTSDIMFFNNHIEAHIGRGHAGIVRFLKAALAGIFDDFPHVKGIIFRMGESDGLDVDGEFKSRLIIKHPRTARRYINALLPVFEEKGRMLIFRTWSVGAYPIGDLMWNRRTFRKTFQDIASDNFVLSLKFGESDFFRYLPLNKHFFRSGPRKIIELQARREYEGFGEYPSFVGWDYEVYAKQLADCPDVIGAWIWCQTGGWTRFNRLTFLEERGIWNEINTVVALKVFKEGISVEEALEQFMNERVPSGTARQLVKLLRQSEEVIRQLLYMPEFSRRKIYFRRLRMPTLLWVYWDNILITHSLRKILRCFISDGEACIREGYQALDKIQRMKRRARKLGLPEDDFDFQYATFEILAKSREYFFRPYDEGLIRELSAMVASYRVHYPTGYTVVLDFKPVRVARRLIRAVLRFCLRDQRGYRLIDRLFILKLLSVLYPLLNRFGAKRVPAFAARQAMGVESLFR
ncbi:MAG: hypothetical protein EOM20_02720 [Spartobacteria bacterium]|nr:hypothetical protein [Spartobacteria bacterium]